MKKILFSIAFVGIAWACSTSPEHSIQPLIEGAVMGALNKPSTYQPIQTEIDSAFSPQDDADLFRLLSEITDLNQELSLTIGKGSVVLTGDVKEKIKDKTEKVADILQRKKTFVGYKVTHTFTAENNLGENVKESNVYLVNKDGSKILFSMTPEDYAQLQQAIVALQEKFQKRLDKPEEQ